MPSCPTSLNCVASLRTLYLLHWSKLFFHHEGSRYHMTFALGDFEQTPSAVDHVVLPRELLHAFWAEPLPRAANLCKYKRSVAFEQLPNTNAQHIRSSECTSQHIGLNAWRKGTPLIAIVLLWNREDF